MHTCMHRRFGVQIRPANMSVVLLSEYAAGLADGSEFVVEDLAKNIKLTYCVWKGTAYVKTETPTSVRDFHDHDDFQNFDYTDFRQLLVYNDQVWTRTWTEKKGYFWAPWEP